MYYVCSKDELITSKQHQAAAPHSIHSHHHGDSFRACHGYLCTFSMSYETHILCLIGYQAVPKSLTHRFLMEGPWPSQVPWLASSRRPHLAVVGDCQCPPMPTPASEKKGVPIVIRSTYEFPHHSLIWLKNWLATIFFKEIAKGLLC